MRHSSANYLEVLIAQQSLLSAEQLVAQDSFDEIQRIITSTTPWEEANSAGLNTFYHQKIYVSKISFAKFTMLITIVIIQTLKNDILRPHLFTRK